MKILKIFWKSLKEQARDPVTLGLSLVIGPFFVLLYWLMIPSGSTTYGVLVQNLDTGPQGREAITLLETLAYPNGDPLLDVISVSEQARAEDLLKDREAFEKVVDAHQKRLKEFGDWRIFPQTVEMIARGHFSIDEDNNVYVDGQPVPKGYRLKE